MIYLASPYSHPDRKVLLDRVAETEKFTSEALMRGKIIFSPIVHCHALAVTYGLGGSFEFWKHYNLGMLSAASDLWVLKLEGWEQSVGVLEEIRHAKMKNKKIQYVPTSYFG